MPLSIGIRGAGVAGLSLAARLARISPRLDIHLFETRSCLPYPTRTFCFFQQSSSEYQIKPRYSWSKVSFVSTFGRRIVDCAETPYVLVSGDDFFSSTLATLQQHNIAISWECSSVEIYEGGLYVNSERRPFDIVVDAAYDPLHSRALLWQSFGGMWVKTLDDLFDPEEACLMQLEQSSLESPVSFMYVLPTSKRSALVEHTTFSRSPQPIVMHRDHCEQWLRTRVSDRFEIMSEERGAIPMGLSTSQHPRSVYTIGTCGGAVRPSTGYAFQSIQTQVDSLAQLLETFASRVHRRHLPPHTQIRPKWMELADYLFLRALLGAPDKGNEILGHLVHHSSSRKLLAFLSGTASWADALKVMIHVPWWSMVRGICSSFR